MTGYCSKGFHLECPNTYDDLGFCGCPCHPIHKERSMPDNDCWEIAEAVIGVSKRVLLKGKPGTGKTYAANHLALADGVEVYNITMTEETPMAEIRGHFVTKGGEFVWMDGPAIRAWKEGARLVINEIDHASDDVLTFMYAIMDDVEYASVTLPTGEKVTPADGFHLIATMNGDIDDLPDALQDRLPVSIEIDALNPEALKGLPEDLRDPASNTTLLSNAERSISIRAWSEFAMLREAIDPRLAAEAVFGDNAADAVLALAVAETASKPHDMEGTEIVESDLRIMRSTQRINKWANDRVDSGYDMPTEQQIIDELAYVIPSVQVGVEIVTDKAGDVWVNYHIPLIAGGIYFSGTQLDTVLDGVE